jgi:hypothetical protein
MSETVAELLDGIANGPSLVAVWDSSRRLMRDKGRGAASNDPLLLQGLRRLSQWATEGSELHRLVAIDLLVRIPASIRKIARASQSLRQEALRFPIGRRLMMITRCAANWQRLRALRPVFRRKSRIGSLG